MIRALVSLGLGLGLGLGCGAGTKGTVEVKLAPAKTEAVHEFEAGVRLAKLGPTNYPRALERFEAAQKIDPALWEAFYDAGWIQRSSHKLDEAAAAFEQALRLNPGRVQTVQALGSVYLERRRFSDAARAYRSFLDRKPPPPAAAEHGVRIHLASALRRMGKLDEAIEELRKVLRAEPRAAPALAGLGLVYEAKGQHELAELVLRRAIQVATQSEGGEPLVAAAAWNDLGLVLLSLRRDQEAFAAFDKAAALDAGLAEAHVNREAVFQDCGDYASAAKELARLTDAQPQNPAAWNDLGVALRGLGKLDESRRAYEHALDIDANHPEALYNMGVLLQDFRKDAGSARSYFERFLHAADGSHPKRADAEQRLKEMKPAVPAPAAAPAKGGAVRIARALVGLALGMGLGAATAHADAEVKAPKKGAKGGAAPAPAPEAKKTKVKTYDFGGLDIDGRLRTPQLLYFLNRMKSEFDTTTPDKRSFMPELQKSGDEL